MKSKFLNLKEFVLVIVLSCLMIGIGYLIICPLRQICSFSISWSRG